MLYLRLYFRQTSGDKFTTYGLPEQPTSKKEKKVKTKDQEKMAAHFTNKVFCLTGAAAGIGLSTAKALLSRGAAVGICDIHEKNLRSAYDCLTETEKSRVLIHALDVTNRAQVKDFLEATKSRFGRVDGVANIAGTAGKSFGLRELWEISSEEYDFVMDVNVRGTFNLLAESMVPGFLEPGSSIVNVGSVASARGYNKGAMYPASKHAVVGLTKSAAIEGGSRDIRVNAILPYVNIRLRSKNQLLTATTGVRRTLNFSLRLPRLLGT